VSVPLYLLVQLTRQINQFWRCIYYCRIVQSVTLLSAIPLLVCDVANLTKDRGLSLFSATYINYQRSCQEVELLNAA
jgi:hypothetical protein